MAWEDGDGEGSLEDQFRDALRRADFSPDFPYRHAGDRYQDTSVPGWRYEDVGSRTMTFVWRPIAGKQRPDGTWGPDLGDAVPVSWKRHDDMTLEAERYLLETGDWPDTVFSFIHSSDVLQKPNEASTYYLEEQPYSVEITPPGESPRQLRVCYLMETGRSWRTLEAMANDVYEYFMGKAGQVFPVDEA